MAVLIHASFFFLTLLLWRAEFTSLSFNLSWTYWFALSPILGSESNAFDFQIQVQKCHAVSAWFSWDTCSRGPGTNSPWFCHARCWAPAPVELPGLQWAPDASHGVSDLWTSKAAQLMHQMTAAAASIWLHPAREPQWELPSWALPELLTHKKVWTE